ncbi:MAG: CPBP family intramembrane metalloprotease [Planctomycetes bacterium]|nr:CPBP family intramembrane metalloprotease [Planctomycetota bacterium]
MAKPQKKPRRLLAPYLEASRTPAASFVFVAPLLALFEVALAADPGVRSGTVPLVRELFDPVSHLGLVGLNLLLLGLLCFAIWRTRAERRRVTGLYGLMFAESLAWAGFMLGLGSLVMPHLLALPELPRNLLGGVGAGIYEEFLFRFLFLGGMVLVLHKGLGASPVGAVPFAIVVSAAAFSYAHHALGAEPYTHAAFLYRALMGVILGSAFAARGLGIVVYAHALYNVGLELLRHVP